ncbi:hypothetical protein HAV22_15565 [Massilia sp. TW-1]|uniref:Uncharacterized protein n=1 Tax=Telluria antibiotica TaxID=2717319 RepID=A0ABX0PCK3_9BURK|nr:hypothetical protein [Telluria antibiotica]NIA55054.1 hypothetical protein [Telluria antibiotica]
MSVSIGAVNELVSVIQGQLAARSPARRPAGRAAPRSTRYAPDQLTALIEQRVRLIGADDPQRGRKAFRVFLEAVLLSHFGEALVADPKFFQVVDEIQSGLEADPACARLIGRAIDHLLGQAD